MIRASVELSLDNEITKRLCNLSRQQDVNPFGILLSTLNVLLYRYTGQEDCCIGKLVTRGGASSTYSYFTEKPFKASVAGEDTFSSLLNKVKGVTGKAGNYEYCIFEKTAATSFIQSNLDITQISQAALVFQSKILPGSEEGDLIAQRALKYELAFVFNTGPAGIDGVIEYDTALYQKETVDRIAGHYKQLLNAVTTTPGERIGALPMLTQNEWDDIIIKFNDTLTPYPADKTLQQLLEEQVVKTPDNVALRQHGRTLTYRELNERANKVANCLLASQVKPGDNVGLLAGRGFDMIIGMYGILKAGCAYVPVDPSYPVDRQEYILSNSVAGVIITDDEYPLKASLPAAQFLNIHTLHLDVVSAENPGLQVDPKQLAYTIYTSGSTGRPKGVMIAHHSAVNLVTWVNKECKVGEQDRLLFITSMCFDLSVYDIFGMLATGGSIVIVKQDELMDVQQLQELMLNEQITFWDSVPTTMDYLVRELENSDKKYLQLTLRTVFMSGDWIPVGLPARIKRYFPNARVISLGGATEGTVWSNFYPVNKVESHWSSIPYGRPLDNNFFYILNEQLQPAPIGVTGELYIGGVGVAEGYANDKEKTNYSFVKDPFNNKAGGRMYRTGDLGKMSPDLNMIFIGRKDTQVKINGFRVELGEIETAINQYELVRQCVVITKADKDGNKRLISYVVGKQGYDRDRVIAHLRTRLPEYMVPTLWVEMDNLPITSNGKIDRKSLPEYNFEDVHKEKYTAAVTELQKELAKIWKAVLNMEHMGVTDNFFDMGGHSLLAVQIMTRVEKLTGKKLPISILFQYPTIEALSGYIEKDNSTKNTWKSLVQIKPSGTKMPFYIVHGIGLNVLNFKNLSLYVDADQPVFGFQAKGLDGVDEPLDDITEIARWYVLELIAHNPAGPYAIGGYSIGGFIAVEMARQLELMNRQVKFLAIFDTDAYYTKNGSSMMPQKLTVREFIKLPKLLSQYPRQALHNLKRHFREPENPYDQLVLSLKSDSRSFYKHMKNIRVRLEEAFERYQLAQFNGSIYLFRAGTSIHFTKDKQYLGWRDYASQGVKEFEVPGDHSTIFNAKNAVVLGKLLQDALDGVNVA